MLLAHLGKSEVQNCIAGLHQYGFAYEEAFDQAIELEQIYKRAIAAPIDDVRLNPNIHPGLDMR